MIKPAAVVRKVTIDKWSTGPSPYIRTTRARVMLFVFGAPALLPIAFMFRSVVTGNTSTFHGAGNDVLGTGGALLLFAMLAVTPLRTLTRRQWFVPLRRWYGVVFALDIFLDAGLASTDPAFNGGPVAELAGHTFLVIGVTMTLLLVPLWVQGVWNQWSMHQLGTHWKPVQRYGTFAVWGLLGLHLMLLEGFGLKTHDPFGPDRFPFDLFHQRFYDYLGCSALLLALRLPPVRRWVRARQDAGETWKVWLAISPLVIVFLLAYGYFINELVYKGVAAYNLNPINDLGTTAMTDDMELFRASRCVLTASAVSMIQSTTMNYIHGERCTCLRCRSAHCDETGACPCAYHRQLLRATRREEKRTTRAQREETADLLAQHFAAGTLEPDEFEDRLDTAMAAKFPSILRGLTTDLPDLPPAAPRQSEWRRETAMYRTWPTSEWALQNAGAIAVSVGSVAASGATDGRLAVVSVLLCMFVNGMLGVRKNRAMAITGVVSGLFLFLGTILMIILTWRREAPKDEGSHMAA